MTKPKQKNKKENDKMLQEYLATYQHTVIHYKFSDMLPHVVSYAAYLTMPETRSSYVGYLHLSDKPSPWPLKTTPKINGPIHTHYKTIHNVISLAA